MCGSRTRTWALVTDGLRARILRGLEAGTISHRAPTELIARTRAQHLWAVLSETPGPGGRARAGNAPQTSVRATGPLLRDLHDFARDIAADLDRHRHAGDFRRLAVFAPAQTLAILHQEMPRLLTAAVFLEREVDLISLGETGLRRSVIAEVRKSDRERPC